MEDVITEIPPPSRFFVEDLNNFVPPPDSIPSPFIIFSNPKPERPLRPSLLIVSISSSSLYIFHNLSAKTLIGTLIIPEIPFSGNTVEPSLADRSCNIYSINGTDDSSILVVSIQLSVSSERSNIVSRLLIGEEIIPERVIIMDSIQSRNFRGRLSPDTTCAYKLETLSERKAISDGNSNTGLKNLEYFPSGSMMDGLSAALMSRCELKKMKGILVVSWPEFGPSAVRFVGDLLKNLIPGLDAMIVNEDLEDKMHSSVDYDLYA